MNIEQAYYEILRMKNHTFEGLLSPVDLIKYDQRISGDKGASGKVVEMLLGINPSNKENDFKDGELKTYKADTDGIPKETVCLTMITPDRMKQIIEGLEFRKSFLYEKIKVILYVPIIKVFNGKPLPFEKWSIGNPHLVNLDNPIFKDIYDLFLLDYEFIQNSYKSFMNLNLTDFSGCSGNFLQVRPKETKGSNNAPIIINDKMISKGYCGFYLSTKFMKHLNHLYNIEMGYEDF